VRRGGAWYARSVTSELDRIRSTLCQRVGARLQAAWLFGSRARGEERPGSDYDLAVLTQPPLGLDRLIVAERIARDLGADVDLIDLRTATATLAWEVITTGRLFVEVDEAATSQFVRRARFDADDELRRNRIVVEAQRRLP
jgi:uncharacterized protein